MGLAVKAVFAGTDLAAGIGLAAVMAASAGIDFVAELLKVLNRNSHRISHCHHFVHHILDKTFFTTPFVFLS
jgi:hypothetical protein